MALRDPLGKGSGVVLADAPMPCKSSVADVYSPIKDSFPVAGSYFGLGVSPIFLSILPWLQVSEHCSLHPPAVQLQSTSIFFSCPTFFASFFVERICFVLTLASEAL